MGPIRDYMILVFNLGFIDRSFTVASPFPATHAHWQSLRSLPVGTQVQVP